MSTIILIFRSIIFNILFTIWTIFLSTACIPITWLGYKNSSIIGRIWTFGIVKMLKWVCNIRHEVIGYENLPNTPCVLVSKHQSAWDTMIYFSIAKHPAFILKKELLKTPFFGGILRRMGMIAVDREGGASALKNMLKQVKERLQQGFSIIIFPEGTRMLPGEVGKYHPGVAAIYNDKDINTVFVPISLNSGLCWGKNSFIKKPGLITMKIHPAIEKSVDRKEFMRILQERVEDLG